MNTQNLVKDTVDNGIVKEGFIKKNDLHKKKNKKVRSCANRNLCIFKNVWINPERCYASFPIWHTCLNKGEERKV